MAEVLGGEEERKFRIRIDYKTLLYISFPIIIALFLHFLLVPSYLIIITIAILYAFIFLSFLYSKIERKDDMVRCWEYAKKFWKKFRNEELDTYTARAFCRFFGDEKMFAFVVNRKLGGVMGGQPLVLIVSANGPEIRGWDDKPTYEKIQNPFIDISPYLVGTPSKSIRPETEPVLRGRVIKEKEKKEEGEEEELGEE